MKHKTMLDERIEAVFQKINRDIVKIVSSKPCEPYYDFNAEFLGYFKGKITAYETKIFDLENEIKSLSCSDPSVPETQDLSTPETDFSFPFEAPRKMEKQATYPVCDLCGYKFALYSTFRWIYVNELEGSRGNIRACGTCYSKGKEHVLNVYKETLSKTVITNRYKGLIKSFLTKPDNGRDKMVFFETEDAFQFKLKDLNNFVFAITGAECIREIYNILMSMKCMHQIICQEGRNHRVISLPKKSLSEAKDVE